MAHLVLACYRRFTFAAREDQYLVDGVHLVANVAADGDLHGHQLAVQTGVHDLSELAEGSNVRGEFREVHHLVLGRVFGHVGVFAHLAGCC